MLPAERARLVELAHVARVPSHLIQATIRRAAADPEYAVHPRRAFVRAALRTKLDHSLSVEARHLTEGTE